MDESNVQTIKTYQWESRHTDVRNFYGNRVKRQAYRFLRKQVNASIPGHREPNRVKRQAYRLLRKQVNASIPGQREQNWVKRQAYRLLRKQVNASFRGQREPNRKLNPVFLISLH